MKLLMFIFFWFSACSAAATSEDLPFLDENIKIGIGLSYSKLESNSFVGNYFLLSKSNPRFEISYLSPVLDLYRHKFTAYYKQEVFQVENPSFVVSTRETQGSLALGWQPTWLSEDKVFHRYFRFGLKNSSVVSELPDTTTLKGDIANRYSLEAGLGFTWYALTVSKFPVGIDAEIIYSQTIFDHSKINYYNGFTYRFGIDFEFKKRTLFTGWGFRAFYEFTEVKNEFSQTIDKEIGVLLNKAFIF